MKIFITEDKKDEMSELCEKMLHYGGKLMSCLEALDEEDDSMGQRGAIGMRSPDDYRYPSREEMRDGMDSRYGERRERYGRHSRY